MDRRRLRRLPLGLALLKPGNGGVLRIDKVDYEPAAGAKPRIVEANGGPSGLFSVHLDGCLLSLGGAMFEPLVSITGRGTLTLTRNRISHASPVLEFDSADGAFSAELASNQWTRPPVIRRPDGGSVAGVIQRNERYLNP